MDLTLARQAARVAVLGALLWAVMSGLGLLLTRVLDQSWPIMQEDELSRALEQGRTETLNDVTYVLGGLGNTPATLFVTIVVALVLRWLLKRWREALFLVVAVTLQSAVSLLTTLVIRRIPPEVTSLDNAPTTSSFPAGHAGAAAALFLASALIIAWHVRNRLAKITIITLFLALPILVAYALLYRGMHHPSDVVASYVSALGSIAIARASVMPKPWRRGIRTTASPDSERRAHPRRAAIIYNPTKVPDFPGLKQRVEQFMLTCEWATPLWLETTEDDPGISMCERAVEDKVDVVFVCGGDGTVMAAVTALAGRDMPMAILPAGTGNLLARNLNLPLDDEDATLRIGVGNLERVIDVGAVEDRKFAVMAGIGFDAAIMRDARPRLKKAVGWPAYILSAGKHLRGEGMRMTLTLDDAEPMHRRARTVVVGNVGKLQANIPLLPDAQPDDGLLDVVLLAPHGTLDWGRVAGRVLSGRSRNDKRVERFRARRVLIETTSPQPRQLDGDLISDGTTMDIQIEERALRVRVGDLGQA